MNSKVLQERYVEAYQKLFFQCPLVLSVPLGCYWADHHSSQYNGIQLRQKLATKIFLGTEFIEQPIIEFGLLRYLSNKQHQFVYENFNQFWPNRLEFLEYINQRFIRTSFINRGIRFHVLVEDNLYNYPVAIQSTICSLIATALSLVSAQLTVHQLINWKSLSPNDLIKDEKYGFKHAFNLARVINYIAKKGYTWNTVCFSAMAPTSYPIITFPTNTCKAANYEQDKKLNFTPIAQAPFWGYDLRDLYPDLPKEAPNWPLDFASIFSGKTVRTDHITLKGSNIQYGIKPIQEFVHKKFALDVSRSSVRPSLYKSFSPEGTKKDYCTIDLLSASSIQLIEHLYQLFSHGYSENAINDFINMIQARHYATVAIDPPSEYMRKLFHSLNAALFRHNPSGNFAVFAMYDAALGGNIGFVGPIGMYRDCLENTISDLHNEYPDISADYFSWSDGYSSDGVTIEQFLDKGIMSKHLDRQSVQISTYQSNQKNETFMPVYKVDLGSILSDIIIDLRDNTLLVARKPVSSKELHSQTATIQLLNLLLQSSGWYVSSSSLPRSAYSVSKNEMQGKIIGPFTRLVKERVGKNLEVKLSGTNIQFSIVLKSQSDVSITVIRQFS